MTPTTHTTATRDRLATELQEAEHRTRVRQISLERVLELAAEVEDALADAPVGTEIKAGLWDRLPNSYQGIPKATYVHGSRTTTGVEVHVYRRPDGFGRREFRVITPVDIVVRGPGVHAGSGAADAIDDLTFLPAGE